MAFCTKCGARLSEGARFCSKCGNAVSSEMKDDQKARKEEFTGTVYKCPSCGQALGAFDSTCPSCGYELRGSDVSRSMRNFLNRVAKASEQDASDKINGSSKTINSINRVASEIKNYAIPNTREDIFEFMILAHSTICSAQGGVSPNAIILEAWIAKAGQAYQKAQLVLSGDDLEKIENMHSEITFEANRMLGSVKRSELNEKLKTSRFFKGALGLTVGAVLLVIGLIVEFSGENSSIYQLLGVVIVCLSAWAACKADGLPSGLVIATLSGVGCGAGSWLLSTFGCNGSMFALGSMISFVIAIVGFFRFISK